MRLKILKGMLRSSNYRTVSSQDIGLPLGIRALVAERNAFPKSIPFQTGGDTVKLVSSSLVIWADQPYKFEAGTPSIMNTIALAKSLKITQYFGDNSFLEYPDEAQAAADLMNHDELAGYSGKKLLLELRKTQVGRYVNVPTAEGDKPFIHLDNAASTPTFFPIWDVVCKVWRQPEKVRSEIAQVVREICADFLGAPSAEYDIIFCSNTTEALNLAAQSLENEPKKNMKPLVLNTLLEHHSNELIWRYIPGVSLIRLPVDREGFVNLEELQRTLREYNHHCTHGKKRIKIVAVSGASNVLGSWNDIYTIGRIAHTYGAHILVDGAQLIAHRKLEMKECGIDYLAFSGHKMYAPFGSGALVVRKGLLHFDKKTTNTIRASGEENTIGIAAMGKAVTLLRRIGMEVIEDHEKALTRHALWGFSRIPGIEVFGVRKPDSPRFERKGGLIAFSLKKVPHTLVAHELGEQGGIGVRNGCFCAHLLIKRLLRIHPVRAFAANVCMILSPEFTRVVLPGLVRLSFGIENDNDDVEAMIHVLEKIAGLPRAFGDRVLASTHNGTPSIQHTKVQDRITDFILRRTSMVYSFVQDEVPKKDELPNVFIK
jgi:selenocysteine lyase/cysteine desulfurase